MSASADRCEWMPAELAGMDLSEPLANAPWSRVYRGVGGGFASPVALKVFLDPRTGRPSAEDARNYFDLLTALRDRPSLAGGGAVPRPLGFFEKEAVVVSEWINGPTFTQQILKATLEQACETAGRAGRWIADLHQGFGVEERPLDLDFMLERLDRIDADHPRPRPVIRRALAVLRREAAALQGQDIAWCRLHGDFKPDNLISASDGHLVGIDFDLIHRNAAVKDAAHFLNQLAMAFLSPAGLRYWPHGARIEAAFCSGYEGGGLRLARPHMAWCRLHAAVRLGLTLEEWSRPPRLWATRWQVDRLLGSLIRSVERFQPSR